MTKIEELKKKLEELSPRELSLFREWFATFDAEIWDRQLGERRRGGEAEPSRG